MKDSFEHMDAMKELAQELCEKDDLNEEMTFGQSKEVTKELAMILTKDMDKLAKFILYGFYHNDKAKP